MEKSGARVVILINRSIHYRYWWMFALAGNCKESCPAAAAVAADEMNLELVCLPAFLKHSSQSYS